MPLIRDARAVSFVLFDMDDVLYDFDHEVRIAALERLTGRGRETFEHAIWHSGWETAAEAGDPATPEAYLAGFAERLGHPIDAGTWTAIRAAMMRPRPAALALASAAAEQADAALLTNNGMLLKAALPVCAPEAVEIFGEKSHVSAEFGARKPDPDVFLRICARYGHDPRRTFFIDDRPENIEGAEAAGLIAHLYETPDGLRRALRALDFEV
ncbi:HAD-IA family hydrolase [Pannonibacter tanglangensis]|uniref:HAD-IA family hydrolase n=1 Tax=Pannonibacter tanglangensis TaxID=2750084 RepID=A0ABW9ZJ94_9HYPH|nr:HAD-IA family hydrolase [Pannonibacter sp. XCT-34]NBN64441.1 HAD-IA family hydrolase [Pannonibacter sp. XCT-34]